jgi:hypothetical protein
MDGFGLYNYPRRLELAIDNLNKDQALCEENKKAILLKKRPRILPASAEQLNRPTYFSNLQCQN